MSCGVEARGNDLTGALDGFNFFGTAGPDRANDEKAEWQLKNNWACLSII